MNSKQLTSIALKVFAIYVFIQTVLAIPSFFRLYIILGEGTSSESANWLLAISSAAVFLLIVLAISIWKLSVNVASQAAAENNRPTSALTEAFILSVLGLYLIFEGLTRLSFSAVNTYFNIVSTTDSDDILSQNIVYLIIYSLHIIIGITLVVKSDRWTSILRRLREAGLNE